MHNALRNGGETVRFAASCYALSNLKSFRQTLCMLIKDFPCSFGVDMNVLGERNTWITIKKPDWDPVQVLLWYMDW